MKIRRKSDGAVKDIPDNKAEKFLNDPGFEAVSEQKAPEISQPPASLAQSAMGIIVPGLKETSAAVRGGLAKLGGDQRDFSDLFAEKMADPTSLEQGAQDLIAGGIQGGTAGFSDEIAAAVKALGEKGKGLVTGEQTPDLSELYRQYQLAEQEANKQAQERSPLLYGAGELGGTVESAFLTAGAAPASMGLREAAKLGAGKVATELGKRAVTGAALGGIQSAGASEGNLDSVESRAKLTHDIESGAITGAVLSPAMSIAGAGLGAAKDKIAQRAEQNPFWKQLIDAYNRGKTATPIGKSEAGMNRAAAEKAGIRNDLSSQLLSADELLNNQFEDVINKATSQGIQVPMGKPTINSLIALNDLFSSNKVLASTPEAQKLVGLVGKVMSNQSLSPREALDLKFLARDLGDKLQIPGIQQIAGQITEDISGALKSAVPGFDKANQLIAGFRGAAIDPLIGKQLSSVAPGKRTGLVGKKLERVLGGLRSGESTGLPARETVNNIFSKLQEFEQQNPGILDTLGIKSPEDLAGKLTEGSDVYNLINKLLGSHGLFGGPKGVASTVGSELTAYGSGKLYGASQLAGGGVRKAGQIFNAPIEEVGKIAQQLSGSQNPMAQDIGNYLQQAVQNKDDFKKNSALFIINQNPALKAILGFDTEE